MTSWQRLLKQAIYLLLFLLTPAFLIILLLWSYISSWTAPAPAGIPQPDPIIVEQVDFIQHADTVDIVAQLRNPNPRAGVPSYEIVFAFLDREQKELDRLTATTYLLPGSIRYVTVLGLPISYEFASITVAATSQPQFVSLASDDTLPSFNSFLGARNTVTHGEQALETQTGIITNRGSFGYQRVDLTAVAFDSQNHIVGVGNTFIGNLEVGQQRSFIMEWPKPVTDTQRVIIIATTNIFDPSNILTVQGDPANLR